MTLQTNDQNGVPAGSRFPWIVVTIVLLAVGAAIIYLARPSQIYTFRFRTHDGARYREETSARGTASRENGKPAPYNLVLRREFQVKKTPDGYRITATPTVVKATMSGRRDPTFHTVESAPYEYHISPKGRLISVTVAKSGIAKIRGLMHGPAYGMSGMIEPYVRHVTCSATDAWGHSVASLNGRTARVGDAWTVNEPTNLGVGEVVEVPVRMVFSSVEKRKGTACAVIDYRIAADNEAVRKRYEAALGNQGYYYGGARVTDFTISGGGQMIVEIDGLRAFSDSNNMDLAYTTSQGLSKSKYEVRAAASRTFDYAPRGRPGSHGTQ